MTWSIESSIFNSQRSLSLSFSVRAFHGVPETYREEKNVATFYIREFTHRADPTVRKRKRERTVHVHANANRAIHDALIQYARVTTTGAYVRVCMCVLGQEGPSKR